MSPVDWDDELKQLLGDPCPNCGRQQTPPGRMPDCYWCFACTATECQVEIITAGPGDPVCIRCDAEITAEHQHREAAS